MELELGLKLARVADEFTSADLQIAKDRTGPLFVSRETDTMFILTARLKGYKKRNIKIEINEDGTCIVIGGEKAVQETVFVGRRLHKKEIEIRGFRKGFKIPDGVILDKIRAKFDEDESVLTISMPKKEKGIRGDSVEEVKEHELARGGSETLRIDDHDFPREKITKQEGERETEDRYPEEAQKSPEEPEIVSSKEPRGSLKKVESAGMEAAFAEETQQKSIHDLKEQAGKVEEQGENKRLRKVAEEHGHVTEEIEGRKAEQDEATQGSEAVSVESTGKAPIVESTAGLEGEMRRQKLEKEEISQGIRGNMEAEHDQNTFPKQTTDRNHGKENNIKADEEEESSAKKDSQSREERGRFRICTPTVAGSALLLSIVVFVVHFIQTKSKPGKRKE